MVVSIPESKTVLKHIKRWSKDTRGANQLINSNRRFITNLCESLKISRKKYKKLMKNQTFRDEIQKQLENIN